MIRKNKQVLYLFFILCFSIVQESIAQLRLVPLPHQNTSQKVRKKANADTVYLELPFFDDFASVTNGSPDADLWLIDDTTPFISSGFDHDPPTVNMATFDGANALGERYEDQNAFAEGIADELTSQFFNLEAETPGSVDISFFWQEEGLGEGPSPDDSLKLQLKDTASRWVTVWSVVGDSVLDLKPFSFASYTIEDPAFYHKDFQFRFQNYGKLYGAFDTWNLDYINLFRNDRAIENDVAMSRQPTSLLKELTAMPKKQFLANPQLVVADTIFGKINNLSSNLHIITPTFLIKDGKTGMVLDKLSTIGDGIFSSKPGDTTFVMDKNELGMDLYAVNNTLDFVTDTSFQELEFSFQIDSLSAEFFYFDDIASVPPGFKIPTHYNDTISGKTVLSNYFAYDDGVGEYAVGIFQRYGLLAVEFETTQEAFIDSVAVYFPQIGESLQGRTFGITLWESLDFENPENDVILTQFSTAVTYQDTLNKFTVFKIPGGPQMVNGKFYIGVEQLSEVPLLIGWDKTTNSNHRTYFNVFAEWQQNMGISGSVMIRPIVIDPTLLGVEEELLALQKVMVYPNPVKDILNIDGEVSQIQLLDITGRVILTKTFRPNEQKTLDVYQLPQGLYLLNMVNKGAKLVKKIKIE
ncbi:T9SS type A sorting domain-containing protein [Flexithrix dorotheae]|uniref:T9SS type A sorting domain-containing protein n=1 Tax=Flexithrix dorotheae TaxID=70993 RepID=UPI00037CC8FF|nr:T9SS type A sorting domain-containing protein [Flexithrix dorotheae]